MKRNFFSCPFFFLQPHNESAVLFEKKKENKLLLAKEKQAGWRRGGKEEWIKICISQRTGVQEKAHESQSNFIQLGPEKSKLARSSETE